jgi:fibronectin type 3 domain-containing protein
LADDLKRDFVMQSAAARTFKVDLPNGNYSVSVTMGDNDYAHDNMIVKANGATVLADVDNAVGAFTINTFNVTASGGSLTLEFSDGGGTDLTWVVNAVSITAQ